MGEMVQTPATMLPQIFAALALLTCVALALHMALRPRQCLWLDTRLRRLASRARSGYQYLRTCRERRRLEKTALAEAAAAIERARAKADGSWEGNVYRPRQFEKKDDQRRDDKRNLH